MVSPADGEEPHCVCRRPLGPASRKQTNNLILVIRKCVNTSAWKPICQRLNYGVEALMKAVERRCPEVVGLRSESGHPTHVSVKHWFPERARQALRASPPPNLPLGAPCFQREPPRPRRPAQRFAIYQVYGLGRTQLLLSLGFLITKMSIIMIPSSQSSWER